MNALQGPCLAFKSDVFVVASAELRFTNCHNIVQPLQPKDHRSVSDIDWDFDTDFDLMQISALDAEAAEVDGGAMNVRGNLMVMGTLTIRDCRAHENGGSLGSNMVACLQELMLDGHKKVDLWVYSMLSFRMPLVLQNRLLGGQAGRRIFVAFGCRDFCLPRCDCSEAAFFPQRKHLHHQFFGREEWRCPAPEFLRGRDNLAVAGGSTGVPKKII